MSDTFEHIELLIIRALENSLDKAGVQELQAWLEEDGSHRRYYEEIRKTWEVTGTIDVDYEPDINANWAKFNERIQTGDTPKGVIRNFKWYALRAAAAILLLGGAATLYFTTRQDNTDIVISTAAAKKTVIQLPDGTRVFMNEQSHIRYAKQFKGNERAVYLDGEAFFDVAKDEQHPFIVHTNHTRTQVLGTTFDVKAYNVQPAVISVLSGKVAVSGKETNHKEVILTPGRRATFKDGSNIVESAIADVDFIAWKENMLVFENEQLNQVAKTLEAFYGVNIRIEDNGVAAYEYNGHFSNDARLEDVLHVISESAGLSWSKEKEVYILKPR